MKHRGKPQGMNYADVLARKRAAASAAVQAEADARVQRALWQMMCSMADAYGLGPKRIRRFLEALQANTEELERLTREVDAEYAYEKLRQRAEQVSGMKISNSQTFGNLDEKKSDGREKT